MIRRLAPIILCVCAAAHTAHAQDDDTADQDTRREQARERARDTEGPTVSFGVFSEPIELPTLIDYVGASLGINIVVKGTPTGELVFNAPVEVPKSKLIDMLDAMLEQYNYTITHEPDSGFWIVQPIGDVKPVMSSKRASTRIIPTPNIKPSLLAPALRAALGGGGGAPRNPQAAQGAGAQGIQAIDELGVIIINAPARDIERVMNLTTRLLEIDEDQSFIRFELEHVAAPVARDRAIGLTGGAPDQFRGRAVNPAQRQNQNQETTGLAGSTLSNLADRIAVDPQGNALIFKGTEEEIARVKEVLSVIDVPNILEPKSYFAGSSAAQIADIAARRGLGEVIRISNQTQNQPGQGNLRARGNRNVAQQFGQSQEMTGGPVMVVDTSRGDIIYYGTPAQQEQLATLMEELDAEDERVVIREVILNHSDAETVAELMNAIITGEQQTGESDFLPGSSGPRQTSAQQRAQQIAQAFGQDGSGSGSDVNAAFDPNIVSVIADPDNNQVIVRAPIKQQDELSRLIGRLDRRTPQVYIRALIVSVTDTENFTLDFESQIMAGQFSATTGNDLFNDPTGSAFGDLRDVTPGLGGLSAAVIMTDQIPIVINANQTNDAVRILSTPQLLVNDNQEAEIVSVSEQPFQEVSQGDGGNVTAFGGFAEAGTTLRVTPSISDGGFLRLEYFIELSNFTAAQGTAGSPPPRDSNIIEGAATIPSDATIVIGGITVDNVRNTVAKIPLLGDIPIVGELFKDRSKIDSKSKLYVFLTPRIMTDPNFLDLKLLSEGPYAETELDPQVPELESAVIGASALGPRDAILPPPPVMNGTDSDNNDPDADNEDADTEDEAADPPPLTPAVIEPADETE